MVELIHFLSQIMSDSSSESESEGSINVDIIGKRKSQKTLKQYRRKWRHFVLFMEREHPEFVVNGAIVERKLKLITPDQFRQFFDYIKFKRNRAGGLLQPTKFQSFQHVSGYKSAIKDHFHTVNMRYMKLDVMLNNVNIFVNRIL